MTEMKIRMYLLANPQVGFNYSLEAASHYTSVNV